VDNPTVGPNETVTARVVEASGQVHDVKLKSGPKGVKRFHSDPAASDYTYRRTLTVTGTYKLVCTYHEEMTMTIRVRR